MKQKFYQCKECNFKPFFKQKECKRCGANSWREVEKKDEMAIIFKGDGFSQKFHG